jgi:hypothetical protein
VVDGSAERRAEEGGFLLARQVAAQHQPDHGREGDATD